MKENTVTRPEKDMANKVKRPLGIVIVAILMILFGLAEVVTSFTHNFFGISTSSISLFTYSAAAIGLFYVIAGLLSLTMKKWAAMLAIVFLIADIVGRIALVAAGLYPLNSTEQIFAIIVGTVIAVIFAIYIGLKLKSFR
jgi:small-conductance mechanosensitive channel